MTRNPENKRLEILLTPEQYAALKEEVKLEFTRNNRATPADMAAYVRSILAWAIPAFGDARQLPARGKYKR